MTGDPSKRKAMFPSALAALFLVAAASSAARAADEDKLAHIKTIGVVSALGDTLNHLYVGTTAFANKEGSEDISDWQIDEFVIAEFASRLAGRAEVRPVVYDKSQFHPETGGIFVRADLDVEERIAGVRPADPAQGVDAYIVVWKSVNQDYVARTNQHLRGIGLYRRGFFGKISDAIYASARVTLVDARTNKEIDAIVLLHANEDNMFGRSPPFRRVENLWGDNFAMTPEQRAQVRDEFKGMLGEAIAMSLTRLELVAKP